MFSVKIKKLNEISEFDYKFNSENEISELISMYLSSKNFNL